MTASNLEFVLTPIDVAGLELGEGTSIRISRAIVQRTAALRAYSDYANNRDADWIEKLSWAYVVAIATRSADENLMSYIQSMIEESPPFTCKKCRSATIGTNAIRTKCFPQLASMRSHANALIHHLDNPNNVGVHDLNVQGVFEYCYSLFQEHAKHLFGHLPQVVFPLTMCRKCKAKSEVK